LKLDPRPVNATAAWPHSTMASRDESLRSATNYIDHASPPNRPIDPTSPLLLPFGPPIRTTSLGSGAEPQGRLRRGHSSGDVPASEYGSARRSTGGEGAGGPSWEDPLQLLFDGVETTGRNRATMRRASSETQDRRRRLHAARTDIMRQQASAPIPPDGGQRVRSRTQPEGGSRYGGAPSPADRTNGRGLAPGIRGDQPITTSDSSDQAPAARDCLILPPWQPDSEVSECPICGKAFGFWYRKHHCRKCGRVVCAGCSPHRITIPKQFIVRPPEELEMQQNTPNSPVIDLAGGDGEAGPSFSSSQRRRSQGTFIDETLGGGQEVRLCNPCVPDPNPLPPPTYPPSHPRNSIVGPGSAHPGGDVQRTFQPRPPQGHGTSSERDDFDALRQWRPTESTSPNRRGPRTGAAHNPSRSLGALFSYGYPPPPSPPSRPPTLIVSPLPIASLVLKKKEKEKEKGVNA
jgi:hypothetical protein